MLQNAFCLLDVSLLYFSYLVNRDRDDVNLGCETFPYQSIKNKFTGFFFLNSALRGLCNSLRLSIQGLLGTKHAMKPNSVLSQSWWYLSTFYRKSKGRLIFTYFKSYLIRK